MRWPALLLLIAVGPTQLGCGDNCGDVACGDPETLYVELPDAAPAASSVEVCFQDACGVADMANRTDGSVPWAEVGDWSDNMDDLVQVSVRASDGEMLSTWSAVADKAGRLLRRLLDDSTRVALPGGRTTSSVREGAPSS